MMDIQINFADAAMVGKRKEQQDYKANLIVKGGYVLYVLADGMGGQIGGATASREVVRGFLDFFNENGVGENPELSLREALVQGNNRLTDILRNQPEMNGMGTTVIALLYHQATNRYWFLSVGDSPLYMQTLKGIKRLNENHAYYEDLLKKVQGGEISQEEADEHPQRHAITSAVMGKEMSLIDTGLGELSESELILLASDGVQTLNDLEGGELEQILMTKESLSEMVSQILQKVEDKKNPYQDNTTLILIEPVAGTLPHLQKKSNTETVAKKSHKNLRLPFMIILSFLLGGGIVFYFLSAQEDTVLQSSGETIVVPIENVVPAYDADRMLDGEAEAKESVPPEVNQEGATEPPQTVDVPLLKTEEDTAPVQDKTVVSKQEESRLDDSELPKGLLNSSKEE